MIKRILSTGNYQGNVDLILLILRLTVGGFMLTHGMGKYYSLIGDAPIQFPDPLSVGATASLALTVFAEVLCSILIIIGLGTRLAAIPLLITMIVAAFVIHGADGFGKQELPLMYAAIYLVIAIVGAGKWSVDNLLHGKLKD
jgi:putative oxidoreductase